MCVTTQLCNKRRASFYKFLNYQYVVLLPGDLHCRRVKKLGAGVHGSGAFSPHY